MKKSIVKKVDGAAWMEKEMRHPKEDRSEAVVLLSGGIDSTVTFLLANKAGWICHPICFNYGQKHVFELRLAKMIANKMSASFSKQIEEFILPTLRGSSLTDDGKKVPTKRSDKDIGEGIPSTYVPARNMIMLSVAVSYAERVGARDIFIGANVIDYSGYPDCRPEFLDAFADAANLGTAMGVQDPKHKIRIHAPLLFSTKAEIINYIRPGECDLGVETISCYQPTPFGRSCGVCDSCIIRKKAFAEVGIEDTTPYTTSK